MNQDPRNTTFQMVSAFQKQMVLNDITRDPAAEKLAHRYLDRHAPDLIGMVLGGVL